jgi:hypothetical protein
MRKLRIILFLLIFLLIPAIPVHSATTVSGRPCPGGASACSTAADAETGSTANSVPVGRASYETRLGSTFAAAATETICSIDAVMYRTGTEQTFTVAMCIYAADGTAANTAFQASHEYTLQVSIIPTSPNGYYYQKTSGTCTSGSEPEWGTTIGATTSDGGCTWTNKGFNTVPGTEIACSSAVNATTFSDSAANVTFTGISANITNGTTYFIVAKLSGYTDTSNYVSWSYATQAGFYRVSGAGTTYSFANNGARYKYQMYK